MFLQTGVVLFGQTVTLDAVAAAFAPEIANARRIERHAQAEGEGDSAYWLGGEGALVVPSGSGNNGAIAVEVFDRRWPDSMGDPEGDPELFGAWSLRHFGIAAFPYGLARAAAHPSAPDAAHIAFVKLSLSYVFGAEEAVQVVPPDRRLHVELERVAWLGERLCGIAGALAWFSPNGEVLIGADTARGKLQRQAQGELVPELWVSTRVFPAGKHLLVETVGMSALGEVPMAGRDHQLLLPDLGLEMELMLRFVRELSGAARLSGSESASTEPVLGPGGRWLPEHAESDNPPPRDLVRWVHESEAGSSISVAQVSEQHAARWTRHLEQHLGGDATVFHELLSDTIHLDVLLYGPTPERPYQVLVTQGMSALPMTVPEGAEQHRFAELMVVLPADWPLEGDEADQERFYWPMRTLKFVARLPHLHATWIGLGHTIPNGDPAQPYAQGSELCCVLTSAPTMFDPDIGECEMADGSVVRLFALLPVFEDEMQFKLQRGSGALFEKLAERRVTELFDVARRSVLAKRFWIV